MTLTVSAGPGTGSVPATAGLPRDEASEKLEAAGFEVRVETVNSASVEEGLVIHSEPAGGKTATHGSTSPCSSPPGRSWSRSRSWSAPSAASRCSRSAAAASSRASPKKESSAPVGEVIRQSPSAGSEVEPGSTVAIVVSAGKQEAKVPNVIGKLRSEAVEALRAAGLRPTVEEEETEVPSKVGRADRPVPAARLGGRTGLQRDDRRRQAGAARSVRKKKNREGRGPLRRPLLRARRLAALGRLGGGAACATPGTRRSR